MAAPKAPALAHKPSQDATERRPHGAIWAQQGPALLLALVLGGQALPALANNFKLPYEVAAMRAMPVDPSVRPRPCPDLVNPPFQLQHGSRYKRGDGSISQVDPQLAAAEIEATRPVRQFNRIIADMASISLKAPQFATAAMECVVRHLDHWASGRAYLGENSNQGEYEKKWGSITYALAYIESRQAATPAQRTRIEAWLSRMGHDVHAFYSRPAIWGLNSRNNNHAYWAALSCAAVGMASNDQELFHWGMSRFVAALDDIDPSGHLPLELRRGPRALEYHAFALGPLLLLAAIAKANAVTVPAPGLAALHRLADSVRAGMLDPDVFTRLTGQKQTIVKPRPAEWAWAELALHIWPDSTLDRQIAKDRPYFHIWLGGDLSIRYANRPR
ncbi:alginate lyase family protein [Pseudaquabacterium pictum]|nr:alginate lyase family protein [Rubrivivax pictus]